MAQAKEKTATKAPAKQAAAKEKAPKIGVVTAKKLRIRKGPGTDHDVDAIVDRGTALEILATKTAAGEKWLKTPAGWVMAKWIEIKEG